MEVKKPTSDLMAIQKPIVFLILFFGFIYFFPFKFFININLLDVSSFNSGITLLCLVIFISVLFINAMIHAAAEHIIYSIVTGKTADVKETNNKKDELPSPRGM